MDSKVTVSCVCWVPRGRCAATPQSSLLQTREVAEALAEHKERCREAEAASEPVSKKETRKRREKILREEARAAEESGEEDSAASDGKEDMEEDGEDSDEEDVLPGVFGVFEADAEAALSDPSLKNMQEIQDEEEEANVILPEDLVLVAANVEQEVCSLELYVHDMGRGALYVHHDIWCGSFPICLEWTGQYRGDSANLVAVGSFECEISLWNLDAIDVLEPVALLGVEEAKSSVGGKRRERRKKERSKDGHQGPVMGLHAHPSKLEALASSSADETVKIWDLNTAACVHTYKHHSDKVQSVQWHPEETALFLSASYDRTAKVVDARNPKAAVAASLTADAEVCAWNLFDPHCCLVSSEDGVVSCFDLRRLSQQAQKGEGSLWRLQAHAMAATGLQMQKSVQGLMVTCGLDEVSRVWDLRQIDSKRGGPTLVFERNLKAGSLYSCRASDVKGVFGFGGEQVVVWDLGDTDVLVKTFEL